MRERILRPLAAGALCICALVVGAKADCIGGAETTTAVNLRTGAGTDSSIVTTVQQGEALIVHADTGSGWYKVSLDGQTGYMSADYLSFSETMALSAFFMASMWRRLVRRALGCSLGARAAK